MSAALHPLQTNDVHCVAEKRNSTLLCSLNVWPQNIFFCCTSIQMVQFHLTCCFSSVWIHCLMRMLSISTRFWNYLRDGIWNTQVCLPASCFSLPAVIEYGFQSLPEVPPTKQNRRQTEAHLLLSTLTSLACCHISKPLPPPSYQIQFGSTHWDKTSSDNSVIK